MIVATMTQHQQSVFRMRTSMRGALVPCICLAVSLTGCSMFEKCGLRECPSDAKISAEVRTLLSQSPALGAPNLISVQTFHSVVYLRGLVSTPYQIAEAGSIAERAPGVAEVQNLLSIDNSR
jgi:osmotically-inducible protein OsmY